jgi:hypothetical protein
MIVPRRGQNSRKEQQTRNCKKEEKRWPLEAADTHTRYEEKSFSSTEDCSRPLNIWALQSPHIIIYYNFRIQLISRFFKQKNCIGARSNYFIFHLL